MISYRWVADSFQNGVVGGGTGIVVKKKIEKKKEKVRASGFGYGFRASVFGFQVSGFG